MNILLVEGINDKYVIQKLLKRRKIEFDNFDILNCENVNKIFNVLPETIQLKTYEEVIGVIVDADEDISDRWDSLRNILRKVGYENVPQVPDAKGTLLKDENYELPKIGVWLMPNNQISGRIEDFIRFLVPSGDEILPLATNSVDNLISKGKNIFIPVHRSKAIIHTWLAWQERPGIQLGAAVTFRVVKTQEHILDDKKASEFVEWLKKLFR